MQLHPEAAAAGVRHVALAAAGSTNAEALARARAGGRGPLWITAESQSAGRGRRGSRWVAFPGNLYASLLLTEPSGPDVAPQLSFVAALAVHDAVADCAPQLGPLLALKWPNDLLLGGAKLGGILIEGEGEPVFSVVIGIGVNCAGHPDDTPYPATDLRSAGALVSRAAVFAALSAAMLRRLDAWRRGEGFAAIRTAWLARAAGRGEAIAVRLPEREFTGRFDGVDASGRLLVSGPEGVVPVTAGEVFGLSSSVPGKKE